jgi:hypothetical protein
MRTSKRKANEPYQSAPTIQTLGLPSALEQIHQRAHEIYMTHGGARGMALSEWLKAEQELKRKLGARTANSQSPPSPVCFQNEVGESASIFALPGFSTRLPGQICRLVNPACAAHAGAERMTLNDWRDVEQEVKRKLENE